MLDTSFSGGLFTLFWLTSFAVFAKSLYNLFFHPLAKVPSPFWARMSGIPSWYYACRGDRHLWLRKQFQIYGYRVRVEPNTVVFCDPQAYADIYNMKADVRRSHFYEAYNRANELNTLTSIDVAAHARKRKYLKNCFTERSIRAASEFVIKHVDRWVEIITENIQGGDESFGKSFDIKEPGDNPYKFVPHSIAQYMRLYYIIMSRVPFLEFLLWLKPRGFDRLLDIIAPPAARRYNQFVRDSVTERIELHREQENKPEEERRQDMFYFLAEAWDPDTGALVYNKNELQAESSLLIIAGSDTSAIAIDGFFFHITSDLTRYNKLLKEIRTTFYYLNDIVYGPRLQSCAYLRACVDEAMRLVPSVLSELPREVLPGGLRIKDEFYPTGTIVGTAPWTNSRDTNVYGDVETFRPERWIVDESSGVTSQDVARIRAGFHPFLSGPGNCVGQNLALAEILITVARTLYQLDVRRAPGQIETS